MEVLLNLNCDPTRTLLLRETRTQDRLGYRQGFSIRHPIFKFVKYSIEGNYIIQLKLPRIDVEVRCQLDVTARKLNSGDEFFRTGRHITRTLSR